MPGTPPQIRQEVLRLLSEASEQQKKAKCLIEMVLKDLKENPSNSEHTVDGVSLRQLRVLTDNIQDKCWANIAKCYRLLETNTLEPSEEDNDSLQSTTRDFLENGLTINGQKFCIS